MNLTLILKYLLFLLMAFVSAALNPYLLAEEHKPAHAFATEPRDVVLPPYVQRGNDVTSRYPSYTARLSKLYEAMRALLSQEAPDLAKKLKSPEPVAYGYQIVPHIVPDKPLTKPLRVTSRACSWGRTEKLIYTELAKLWSEPHWLDSHWAEIRMPSGVVELIMLFPSCLQESTL